MLENEKWFHETEYICASDAGNLKYSVNVYLGDLRLSLTLKNREQVFLLH